MQEQTGIDHEINFWKEFVKTDRFLKGWVEPIKTPELPEKVAKFIMEAIPDKGEIVNGDILDCGSGVVSILNGLRPDCCLISTDLLGDEYSKFFDYEKHKIPAPLPFAAEELPESFENKFDIVHMSNALDHTKDPVKSYERLMACVKPGGHLIIQGFENEGEFEKWQGMHQWNLAVKFVPDASHDAFPQLDLSNKQGHVHTFHVTGSWKVYNDTLMTGKKWFIWICQK